MNDCEKSDFNQKSEPKQNLFTFFRSSPMVGADLDLDRLRDPIPSEKSEPQKRDLGVDHDTLHVADDFEACNDEIRKLFEGP